jgi:hypothetical protein
MSEQTSGSLQEPVEAESRPDNTVELPGSEKYRECPTCGQCVTESRWKSFTPAAAEQKQEAGTERSDALRALVGAAYGLCYPEAYGNTRERSYVDAFIDAEAAVRAIARLTDR